MIGNKDPLSQLQSLRRLDEIRWLGVMSGTSGDGVDVAVVPLRAGAGGAHRTAVGTIVGATFSWEQLDEGARSGAGHSSLGHALIRDLNNATTFEQVSRWHARLGRAFARACEMARDRWGDVDAIALSGHTFAHLPGDDPPSTLQLGDASIVAQRLGCPVVFDFRSSDVARGGEGAPLVPAADRVLFGRDDEEVLVVNLGGISNLTLLPAASSGEDPLACDCGPCNLILNEWMRRARGVDFDAGGACAAAGRVDESWVRRWFDHPFFGTHESTPRSTGREQFGEAWVTEQAHVLEVLSLEDVLATTAAWIARAIEQGWRRWKRPRQPRRVLLGGGGVHHQVMVRQIEFAFPHSRVEVLNRVAHGVDADLREAAAFAILGELGLQGEVASFPTTTGCRHGASLGAFRFP